jgi:Amt family ammonium transporter
VSVAGFNGGSALNASLRAIYAGVNTNLAAACGAMTFCALDVLRHKKRWSMVGLCCGAVAGLVGITPASGFIPIYFAVPVGVVTGLTTHLAMGACLSSPVPSWSYFYYIIF